jgi:hypothetical protein
VQGNAWHHAGGLSRIASAGASIVQITPLGQ